jgi:2-hydroxychromene-2-carboxylate isomerase
VQQHRGPRVALLGVERGWGPAFIRAALAANFADDRDIAAPDVIDDLLAGLGLMAALRDESMTPAHRPRCARPPSAPPRSHLGAPSFVVGDELFGATTASRRWRLPVRPNEARRGARRRSWIRGARDGGR